MPYNIPPSVDEILPGQLYIGNLEAAMSTEIRQQRGISHIISVCPEFKSTGDVHLSIPIDDWEYEDLLVHLSKCCEFIQHALDHGGAVLVHCVMGISRSAAVVAAYLMKSKKLNPQEAIQSIKQHRPIVQPNYGFVKQLGIFADCAYDPKPTDLAYIAWKQKSVQATRNFLNRFIDTVSIIRGQLVLSSEMPTEPEQAEALLVDRGITHLLTLSPAKQPSFPASVKHHHVDIANAPWPGPSDELLFALPECCDFVREALSGGSGQVLVYSEIESKACAVVCAYLMSSRKISPTEACSLLEDELPLFDPSASFKRTLELFDSCGCAPTHDHPLVKEWMGTSLNDSQQHSTDTAVAVAETISEVAARMLSETGIDTRAFGQTLDAVQGNHSVAVKI